MMCFCYLVVSFYHRSYKVAENARYVRPYLRFSKLSPFNVIVKVKDAASSAISKSIKSNKWSP